MSSDTPIDEMSFEEAMRALEQVVSELESGKVALEDSIRLYERGAKLKQRCEAKLKDAEEKVAAITFDADGQPKGTAPVDGL
ncbi:exodeoxyribonuclease VII small subunit [Poseidonocella sedimentorum]|uniref:Exodeoxyribonuclease 7 small subunit n=1 Tax=Poseidonocella sedimentorum TaxID=871652 RepID=A0A1I6DU44_9RHOB|nr:exodeoxyribonuclease VII small subunit [Poseidonocella sedimentorum]SFR08872.1 Exodeoxyribonuclease VII small subunit [Poseidonocella sedimentorum]